VRDTSKSSKKQWGSDELEFIRNFNKMTPSAAAEYIGQLYSSRPNLYNEDHIIGFLDSDASERKKFDWSGRISSCIFNIRQARQEEESPVTWFYRAEPLTV
jgi:hypothetical protein